MDLVTPTRCPQCNSSEFTPKPMNGDWAGGADPDFDQRKWEDSGTLVECNYCHTQFMAKGVRKSFDYRNKPAPEPIHQHEVVDDVKSIGYKIIAGFLYFVAFLFGLSFVVGLFQIPNDPTYRTGAGIAALVFMALLSAGLFIAARRLWRG